MYASAARLTHASSIKCPVAVGSKEDALAQTETIFWQTEIISSFIGTQSNRFRIPLFHHMHQLPINLPLN